MTRARALAAGKDAQLGQDASRTLARDGVGRLVSAMLGDPFAFVLAPEVDALRRLLMEPSLTPTALP